jgi:serine/threonine protein kinase
MDSEMLQFTRKEIDSLKMMQHPHICQMFDVFEDDKYFYLVLEMLEGGDLYDYLMTFGFDIPENRARNLSAKLGSAMVFIHSYGIIHRDIKLENIMMSSKTDKAEPKFVDFGLAMMAGPGQKGNELLGTIAYAPPELLLEEDYD